jgi:hypothetical protein
MSCQMSWNGHLIVMDMMSPKRRTYKSSQYDWRSNMPGLRRVLPYTKTSNHSDQLRQSLFPHTLIIDRRGLHAHPSHRNVCKSRSFQLHSHNLQLHKHTNAHCLYRSHLTQDRTTKTKPPSLPLVPELLVILTKWMSRTCLLLQCVLLESCSTPKENRNQSLSLLTC